MSETTTDADRKSSGHYYGDRTVTNHDDVIDTRSAGTTISGQSDVVIDAGHDVLTVGGAIRSAAGSVSVTAGNQISMLAAQDTHTTDSSQSIRESGFEQVPNPHQGTRKDETKAEQVTSRGTVLDASGPIVLASAGDQTYQAVNVRSDTGAALVSGGHIDFVTATDSSVYQRDSSKHNVAYQGQDHRGQIDTSEQQSTFSGPLAIAAAGGITVGVGQKDGETQAQAIARAATTNPSSGWIYALQNDPTVAWQSVDETHTQWHEHHEGLTQAAGAVVTIVVTYFTAGLASGPAAGLTGAAASSGTAAGVGTAVITGAVAGAAGGAAGAASQGNDWKQAALKGAYSGAISAGLFYEAGTLTQGYTSGSLEKIAAHGVAGGAASELTGGKFVNGAVSAGFAEGISPYLAGLPGGSWGQAVGKTTAGAVGAYLSGNDAKQGALSGLNGYLFNDMFHVSDFAKSLATCQQNAGGSGCGTILSMAGDRSTLLVPTDPTDNHSLGLVANYAGTTNTVASYTILGKDFVTGAENQPLLIMEPADYNNFITNPLAEYLVYASPSYALTLGNAFDDALKGRSGQATYNLGSTFTSTDYWRDLAIGMTAAIGSSLPSNTGSIVADAAESASGNASILTNPAQNVGNIPKLVNQLQLESANSPFAANGTLTQTVLDEAIPVPRLGPGQLSNPAIPAGYGKYTTGTYQSPYGDFQVHFYMNPETQEVFYGLDYKSVFNDMSGVPKKP